MITLDPCRRGHPVVRGLRLIAAARRQWVECMDCRIVGAARHTTLAAVRAWNAGRTRADSIPGGALTMTWPQYKRCECAIGGAATPIPGRRPLEMLLLMMLKPDTIISMIDFIDWLWPNPDDEPEDPAGAVRHWIWRLAQVIGPNRIENAHGRGWIYRR